tara:strand:+ start:7370 stop:12928 length:5559 start_codon:yes stop_codon:yes gene_type:complete
MKTLSKSITFLLVCSLIFSSCHNKKDQVPLFDQSFATYINAFTSGIVSKKSSIRISLSQGTAKQISEDLLSFEPKIEGQINWKDNSTIEFVPKENLIPGQVYTAKLYLNKIMEVPDSMKVFEFGFQVIHSNFEWGTVQLKSQSTDQMKWYSLQGTLIAADEEELDDFNDLLEIEANGRRLKPNWENTSTPRLYSFVLDSIERKEKSQELILRVNSAKKGGDKLKDKNLELPGLGEFKYLDFDFIQNPSRSIVLKFSDPIKKDQNLKGLITLEDVNDIKYKIDNTSIILFPPDDIFGDKKLNIFKGIKNILAYDIQEGKEISIAFRNEKPQVRLIGDGNILPSSESLLLPFQAISLNAVDVKVVQIRENNMLQFLQNNNLGGASDLYRVGEVVAQKRLDLSNADQLANHNWMTYSIDLSKLIEPEQGALYRVYLSFKKEYANYICEENLDQAPEEEEDYNYYYWEDYENDNYNYVGNYNSSDYYFSYPSGYRWSQRKNPCHNSYYNSQHFIVRNILASDIGIIVKNGNDNIVDLSVTDLNSTEPISGATIELYNYQQRLVSSGKTDGNGFYKTKLKEPVYFIKAQKNKSRAYVKLDNSTSVSLSNFPVNGEQVKKGIKGFIYGERGVWRPGDSIHLNFILEDKLGNLPPDHPVHFELYNPSNQLVDHQINTKAKNFIRNFKTKTKATDPTGNYEAIVKVGELKFSKTLKIETVKPNRLDIELNFKEDPILLENGMAKGEVKVKWLTGVDASNSKVSINATLASVYNAFPQYKGFVFNDPSKRFESEEISIFEGPLDENGYYDLDEKIGTFTNSPGMLKARFLVKAFEGGGDFSTEYFDSKISPYSTYIGMKMPDHKTGSWYYSTDVDHDIQIRTVDHLGKSTDVENLDVKIYKISSSWWYNRSNGLSQYINNESTYLIQQGKLSTKNGLASYKMNIKYPNWGRYLIRVTGEDGHSTGQIIYVDWPEEQRRNRAESNGNSTELSFKTDQEEYKVGDEIVAKIPMAENSRVLITLENGNGILHKEWFTSNEKVGEYKFTATEEMSPNIYISAWLIQPHAQTENDRPIRLYGISSLKIVNPETQLNPIIEAKDVWRPETTVEVKVKEKDGKPMYYTIAIVDEGLLNLTRFKTPKPWPVFYAKEALGVRTWDLYHQVIGAYSGEMSKNYAIGGDEALSKVGLNNQNRFVPMVRHLGPFKLEKGEEAKHKVKLPNYVGKVKVMVVAANKKRAYGSEEKSIHVRKPLMVLTSLPRVSSPMERISLPVTVFAMEENVRSVDVNVKVKGKIKIVGESTKTIKFKKNGEQVIDFLLETPGEIGTAFIEVNAKSGKEKAHDDTELMVRIPNPPMTYSQEVFLKSGRDTIIYYEPIGVATTNRLVVESYGIPPINLEKRLKYLTGYPHGCAEQTISRVFPLLYLGGIMELSDDFKTVNNTNIGIAIQKLYQMQAGSGGLYYWPSYRYVNNWVTSYAGQFLNQAKDKGYDIPAGMLDKWLSYQKSTARSWTPKYSTYGNYCTNCLDQSYRLYTLAEVGKAEIGAMNRLKEADYKSDITKWNLAGAYLFAGQDKVAREIAYEAKKNLSNSQTRYNNYGSSLRDKAMQLEVLHKLGEDGEAFKVARQISKNLSSTSWYSTHDIAFALKSMMMVYGNQNNKDVLAWEMNISSGEKVNYKQAKTVERYTVKQGRDGKLELSIRNIGDKDLNFSISQSGIPLNHETEAISHNLSLQVDYFLPNGNSLDVSKLSQGQDFYAEIKIAKVNGTIGCENMALSQLFPAGWEIINTRLLGVQELDNSLSRPDYQDIRDDRVYTYFNMRYQSSVKFKVRLNATYAGKYFLPPVYVEDMYNIETKAQNKGRWVEVIR